MRNLDRPDERDVFIDVVRIVAVLTVVVGHWAATTVIREEGRIAVENALAVIPETHLATWLVQVMPLLFFVGGFANARSLARHGDEYLSYLRTRLVRLGIPTLTFMVVWLTVGIAAEALPLPDPNVVERAADLAALPFWFLGMYVIVVALAPPMLRLHKRFGLWVPALLIVGAVSVDLIVHGVGFIAVGALNYAFVWLLPHQLGFFYADGRLKQTSRAFAGLLVAGGLAGLVTAVTVGGYPTSMVGVPGADRMNTDPPSLALVALAMWLIGLALLARPRIESWASRRHRLVSRLSSMNLTLYLWHVSAMSAATAVLYPLGFPRPDTGTALWWAVRPLWLAVLVPFLVLLVYVFRRFELHQTFQPFSLLADHRVRLVAAGVGVVSVALGILGSGASGFDRVASEYGETVLIFSVNPLRNVLHVAVGTGVLWFVYRSVRILPVAVGAAMLYLVLGVAGWSTGIGLLAMNPATARLHVVLGSLGLILLALVVIAGRVPTRPRQTDTSS